MDPFQPQAAREVEAVPPMLVGTNQGAGKILD